MSGLAEYQAVLDRLASNMPGLLHPAMERAADRVRDEATENLSGRVLQQRTGDLLETLEVVTLSGPSGAGIEATAGSPTVRYAAIHEHGGTIHASGDGYLRFLGRFGWAQVRQVTIPARPYLRPAMEAGAAELPGELHQEFLTLMQEGR